MRLVKLKAVSAAQIHKGAEIRDVLYYAVYHVAYLDALKQSLLKLCLLCLGLIKLHLSMIQLSLHHIKLRLKSFGLVPVSSVGFPF